MTCAWAMISLYDYHHGKIPQIVNALVLTWPNKKRQPECV